MFVRGSILSLLQRFLAKVDVAAFASGEICVAFEGESILAFVAGIVVQWDVAHFAAEDTRLECEKARDCVEQSVPSEAGKDAAFAAALEVVTPAIFESFDNRFHHFGALYKNLAILDLKEKKNEFVLVRAAYTCLEDNADHCNIGRPNGESHNHIHDQKNPNVVLDFDCRSKKDPFANFLILIQQEQKLLRLDQEYCLPFSWCVR